MMRALTTCELLDLWENTAAALPAERALALLAAACPEQPTDALAALSIGQRDGRLLTLREWAFGPHFVSLAVCTRCGDRLELEFDADDIRAAPDDQPERLSLTADGYEISFRLPTGSDLASLGPGSVAELARALLGRCVLSASRRGEALDGAELPEHVARAVATHMAEADPQATVELALRCPACGHEWAALFDIEAYFWSEIEAWAIRLLHEVHLLAQAYGWREADILALTPRRRQLYLEMIAG